MTSTSRQFVGPEMSNLIKLIQNGKLDDAKVLAVVCLKEDSTKLEFLVVLHRLKVLLQDTDAEIERSLLGAFEVAKRIDYEVATLEVFIAAARLVMELECAVLPEQARELALTLDRVRNPDVFREFLVGSMWYVLGDPEVLSLLLENNELSEIGEMLNLMAHDQVHGWSPGSSTISRIETIDVLIREKFGSLSELIGALFSTGLTSFGKRSRFVSDQDDSDVFRLAKWNAETRTMLLKVLESRGHVFRVPGESTPSGFDVSEEWLSNWIDYARTTVSQLRLSPDSPSVLIDGELLVAIALQDNLLCGWVAVQRRGLPVSISLTDWTLYGEVSDPFVRFVSGITILWFLDCSLRKYGIGHDHFVHGDKGDWTPVSNGRNQEGSVGSEIGGSRVRGHITRLPQGKVPSLEALSRTPPWIRSGMQSNETWTREHQRGSIDIFDEILKRRSATSFVAEGLSAIRRTHRK